jgi:hypothetical protein
LKKEREGGRERGREERTQEKNQRISFIHHLEPSILLRDIETCWLIIHPPPPHTHTPALFPSTSNTAVTKQQ